MNSSLIRSLSLLAIVGSLAACTNQVPPPVTPASQEPAVTPSPSPSLDPTVRLHDTFDGTSLNDNLWAGYPQRGQILMRNGRLELFTTGRTPNYPYLLTKQRIAEDSGPFYFELTYELLAAGAGAFLGLDYLPAPAPGETALTDPFMRARDNYTDLRMYFATEKGVVDYNCKDGYKVGTPHTMRVEFDGTTNYRVIFDGVEAGTFVSKRRPEKFWVGNYPLKDTPATSDWPHLALHEVKSGYLASPAPAVPRPSPSPTPTPSPTASTAQ